MTGGPEMLARLSARAVPSWCRDRYEVEFRAELADLSRGARWRHAAGLLAAAGPLRIAVLRRAALHAGFPHPTVGCLLGIRHRWHQAVNDDGERYLRCSRCGVDSSKGGPGRLYVIPPVMHG